MAVGYNSSSIIGGPLDKDVLTQLEKREGLYTKRSGRTNEQIMYLTSKTGWVKVSSAVNIQLGNANEKVTVNKGKKDEFEYDGGSNKKAKNNIKTNDVQQHTTMHLCHIKCHHTVTRTRVHTRIYIFFCQTNAAMFANTATTKPN